MLLNNLSKKQIKEISSIIAPKLVSHPVFMFYCKSEKDREKFIEDYFKYFLGKWNNKDIILADENYDAIISILDFESYHNKDKGLAASKLKRYKNPYANVTFHQGNVAYLTGIVAPVNVNTKIMTIYSTWKHSDVTEKLIDEAVNIANQNNYILVYETFSKKAGELLTEKGFELAYEKRFSSTQYFETIMTYYKQDKTKPIKLIEGFKPLVLHDDTEEFEATEKEYSEDQ